MAMLAVLIMPLFILGFSAISAVLPAALAGLANPGARGYTEILYAFSSAAGNNGSAFAGLTANAPWYNTTLGIAMLACRFGIIVPVLAIAGALAAKPKLAPSAGTFPTDGALFVGPAGRRHRHPERPRILPRARARADRRALPDARRQDLLSAETARSCPCNARRNASDRYRAACAQALPDRHHRSRARLAAVRTPSASSTRARWSRTP